MQTDDSGSEPVNPEAVVWFAGAPLYHTPGIRR